jgi:hypothetical protein
LSEGCFFVFEHTNPRTGQDQRVFKSQDLEPVRRMIQWPESGRITRKFIKNN